LLDYSTTKFESTYPFVGVSFTPRQSNKCDTRVTVQFLIAYHTSGPASCNIGCQKCVGSSPEQILCFREDVYEAIMRPFSFTKQLASGDYVSTNLFKENWCANLKYKGIEGLWGFNLDAEILEQEPLFFNPNLENDITFLTFEFTLDIRKNYGAGICQLPAGTKCDVNVGC
jgi:hypothetical protein